MIMDINKKLLDLLTNLLYKVEFSEKQQRFYLSLYSKNQKDSNGYVQVFSCVNDLEFKIFNVFLESNYEKPYKLNEVLFCARQVSRFYTELVKSNYQILPVNKS